jgi:DNA polymerase-3 subunit epsilon
MAEMVAVAERVDPVVCSTPLEAEVRELRLIAEHSPALQPPQQAARQGRLGQADDRGVPAAVPGPQVLDDGACYLGPFGRSATAELAVAAVHEALPLRQCTTRLSPRRPSAACVLAEMRRCGAPCRGPEHGESVEGLRAHAAAYRTAVAADPPPSWPR